MRFDVRYQMENTPRYLSFCTEHPFGDNGFAGRVCGNAIRLGDRFTVAYRIGPRPDGNDASSELIRSNPIDLKVMRIEAYNRELPEIATGYTCLLEFEGDTSQVEPHALIGDENTRECRDQELARLRDQNQRSEQVGAQNP
jgi:hypothetical protein